MRLMGTEGTVMRLFAHGYEGTDMRLMGTEGTVMRLFARCRCECPQLLDFILLVCYVCGDGLRIDRFK